MNGLWHIQALTEGLTAFLVHQAGCETCVDREPKDWDADCRAYYREEGIPQLRRLLGGAALELDDIEKQLGGGR